MNKVITINLNGVAYQLEEGGYDALRAYLDHAARRLEGNPDRDEIITDIEQSIADKFRTLLGAYKTVVNVKEVTGVLEEMGPVEDNSAAGAGASSTTTEGSAGTRPQASSQSTSEAQGACASPRRLYRITDGAMLGGVCNGVAAYFNVDVTLVRLAFALLVFLWGTGVLVYIAMMIIVPEARTSAEKAAAQGVAATAQEFIKRARDGYYAGMRSWHEHHHDRRAWRRKFRQERRAWKYGFRYAATEGQEPWRRHAAPPSGIVGPVFVAPMLSMLLLAAVVLMVYGIYSLAKYHAAFGIAMPAGMPLWVGIVLLVLAYGLVAGPLKAARWACYSPGPYYGTHGGPLGFLWSFVGLFFAAFGIWWMNRHFPEFHEWLVQLPDLFHRAVDTISGWFAK